MSQPGSGQGKERSNWRESVAAWLGLEAWLDAREGEPAAEHLTFRRHVCTHFREGFATMVLLVALATLVHHSQVFAKLTAQSMRLVHAVQSKGLVDLLLPEGWRNDLRQYGLSPDDEGLFKNLLWLADWELIAPKWEARQESEPDVTILRFTSGGFEQKFCGFSPIARAPLAAAISSIGTGLSPRNGRQPLKVKPVIAIDVDITKQADYGGEQTCPVHWWNESEFRELRRYGKTGDPEITDALAELREQAVVVAIVTPRSDPKNRERRNESLKGLCEKRTGFEGVHFATATAWLDPGEPDYRFLGRIKEDPNRKPDWALYPSLGNLLAFFACDVKGMGCGDVLAEIERDRASEASPGEGSTAKVDLCSVAGALVLPFVDATEPAEPSEGSGQAPRARPKQPHEEFDWLYLDLVRSSARILTRDIASWSDLDAAVSDLAEGWAKSESTRKDGATRRPMAIFSIDDGHSDKHFSVMDRSGTTEGDFLQAARALSLIQPLEGHDDKHLWKSSLHDLLLGTIYLGAWAIVIYGLTRRWSKQWPSLAALVTGVAPLGLTLLLGTAAVVGSAHALSGHPSTAGLLFGIAFGAWIFSVSRVSSAPLFRKLGSSAPPVVFGLGAIVLSILAWFSLRRPDGHPTWEDPVLILIGLTLHAYLTVWEMAAKGHAGTSAPSDLPSGRAAALHRTEGDLLLSRTLSAVRLALIVDTLALVALLALFH